MIIPLNRLTGGELNWRGSTENDWRSRNNRSPENKHKSKCIEQEAESINHLQRKFFCKKFKGFIGATSQPPIGVLEDNGRVIANNEGRAHILFQDFLSDRHLQEADFDSGFATTVNMEVRKISTLEQTGDSDHDKIDYFELEKALNEVSTSKKWDPSSMFEAHGAYYKSGRTVILQKSCGRTKVAFRK